MKTTLYKRNASGKPIAWSVERLDLQTYAVRYGIVGGQQHSECKHDTKTNVDEVDSLIKAKRKEGYKSLEDLYDNAPQFIKGTDNLKSYLETYLPKYNISSTGAILPMLAKTLEDNKIFTKGDEYDAQWKINGVRCIIGAEKSNDLFSNYRLTYHSREGTEWKLPWLDDIIKNQLDNSDLLQLMIEEGICLDGELYIPGYKVNDINSIVKNPLRPEHKLLQYWCYDLAIENYSAIARYTLLEQNVKADPFYIQSKTDHLNNKQQFILLPTFYDIYDYNTAIKARDTFINLGFEGLILRNADSEYCFGKRKVNHMYKFKKILDGYFKIIDVVPEGKKRANLGKLVLRNDINSELFECTVNVSQDKQEELLRNKSNYIGNYAKVEYRERSGTDAKVPFHAKCISIVNDVPNIK